MTGQHDELTDQLAKRIADALWSMHPSWCLYHDRANEMGETAAVAAVLVVGSLIEAGDALDKTANEVLRIGSDTYPDTNETKLHVLGPGNLANDYKTALAAMRVEIVAWRTVRGDPAADTR